MIPISSMNEYGALLLVMAIVFGAFVSEDGATITAATLAASKLLDPRRITSAVTYSTVRWRAGSVRRSFTTAGSQVGFRGALLTEAYGLRGRVNLAWPSVDFFPARVYRRTSLLAFAACRFRLF